MRPDAANFAGLLFAAAVCTAFYVYWARELIYDTEATGFDLVFVGWLLGLLTWGVILLVEFRLFGQD